MKNGGAIVDSQTFDVTIPQNLEQGPSASTGGFTKLGSGTVTLTGTNNYTGATNVTGGALVINGSSSIGAGAVLLSGGGSLTLHPATHQLNLTGQAGTAIASSYEAAPSASAAFDGDYNTRWASNSGDPQWIYIDMGADYRVTQATINWEVAAASNYTIQVSDSTANAPNGAGWTVVGTVAGNGQGSGPPGIPVTTNLTPIAGRYLAMYGTARASQYGYSIFEFTASTYDLTANYSVASLSSSDPTTNLLLDPGVALATGTDNTSTTFAGSITGAGSLTKVGSGAFNISALPIPTPAERRSLPARSA